MSTHDSMKNHSMRESEEYEKERERKKIEKETEREEEGEKEEEESIGGEKRFEKKNLNVQSQNSSEASLL